MIINMSLKNKKKKKNNTLVESLIKKEPPEKPTKDNASKFNEWFNEIETDINSKIFQKHFKFQRPSDILKTLYTTNDKKKNSKLVNVIKSGLSDLKNEIEDMSEEEKELQIRND